jgi:two-component system cell cycle sensor histidine kinase/response regulator CckA
MPLQHGTGDDRLRNLSDAMHAFAATTNDYPTLLDTIARCTAEMTRSSCFVGLLSSDGARWERVAAHHRDEDARERLEREELEQLQVRVLQTGQPAWIPPPAEPWLEIIGVCSLLCLPLGPEGRPFGTLLVVRLGEEPLDRDDLDVVSNLAAHASLAITNARTLRQARRELDERVRLAERLRFLSQISRALAASTHDLQRTLDLVARRCAEATGDLCAIHLVSEDGRWLGPAGSLWHADPELRESVRALFLSAPYPMGVGIAGRVAATGQPLVLSLDSAPTISEQALPGFRAFAEQTGFSSVLAVPLIGGGQVLGALSLGRRGQGPPYSEEDVRLLHDVADHTALALANNRLLRSLQDELSQRRTAQEALKRTEEQLLHAQKMEAVGRLAGGIAHDFNNLLSVILSYSDILLMDLPESSPHYTDISEIRRAGQRAAALTSQLLAFSRQRVPEPRVVDLNAVISGMERMIRRLVGEDVSIRIVPHPELGWVRVDPNHLEQVVMNLVVNARDAMPTGGTLVIETGNVELDESYAIERVGTQSGPHVMLAISDTGTGMDPETRLHIFEPFFTTKGGRGTGLGLSTVYGIIKQNHGSIWVYSEPGAGSTFKIYLPRLPAPSGESLPLLDAPVAAVGGKERVLVVEDDDQVRALIRGLLARHGYHVLDAAAPRAATRLAETCTEPIDLLLTDVILPQMGGRELAGRLTSARPGLRVLYMSGYTENAIVLHGVEEGLAVLQKPITPDALLRKVREVLDAPLR